MKRNIRILYLAVVALVAGALTACNSDDYTPGEVPEGAQVYFPNNVSWTYAVSADDTYVDVPVKRVITDEALNVAILSTDESGLFTISENVLFAAGSEDASLRISFDGNALEMGKPYEVTLLLKNEFTAYGDKSVTVTIQIPEPWTSLGKGMWREDIFNVWYDVDNLEYEVTIEESDLNPGYYRIVNLYSDGLLDQLFGQDMSGYCVDNNFLIDATDPDHVVIPAQKIGVNLGDGDILVMSAISDYVTGISEDLYGTMENGVITFPAKGVCIFDDKGGDLTNVSGLLRIVLPGAEVSDYTLAAVYDGMKISSNGETVAALFNLTFGADVASYKYVVAEGDVAAEFATVVAGIVAGSLENIAEGSVDAQSIAVEFDKSGMCSFVAVPYNAAGEAKPDNAIIVTFFFPGASGGTVPDIECNLVVNSLSSFLGEEAEAKYPSTSCIGWYVTATDVKELVYCMMPTEMVEVTAPSLGYDYQGLINEFGTPTSEKKDSDGKSIVDHLNEDGSYLGLFRNLDPGTSYTLLVEIESKYGKKYLLKGVHETAAINYTGELVLGNYYMTYKVNDKFVSENTFSLVGTEDPNEFYLVNIGIEDGTKWHATYDATASTLTCNGVMVGYEDDGNFFGKYYAYFDQNQTQVYAVWSYVDIQSDSVNDPLVFKIDTATKQIAELTTYLDVPVVYASDGSSVGFYNRFVPGTPVELQTSTASVRTNAFGFAKQLCQANNAGFQRAVNGKMIIDRTIKSTMITTGKRALRTVAVKAEPCQRKAPSLERKTDTRNSQALILAK